MIDEITFYSAKCSKWIKVAPNAGMLPTECNRVIPHPCWQGYGRFSACVVIGCNPEDLADPVGIDQLDRHPIFSLYRVRPDKAERRGLDGMFDGTPDIDEAIMSSAKLSGPLFPDQVDKPLFCA